MMVGDETLSIILITGILGYVSHKNTKRIPIYIKVSSGESRLVPRTLYL